MEQGCKPELVCMEQGCKPELALVCKRGLRRELGYKPELVRVCKPEQGQRR